MSGDWRSLIGVPQCADCRDLMRRIPDGVVDLVVTDPPFLKETLYTYSYLAQECPRIMKRGASLFTLVGHFAIPDVVKMFDGHLKYRWIIAMDQSNGAHARMAMGIEVMWKPILWYVKEAYPQGRGFVRDSFTITGNDGQTKKLHKWQQDESWAEFFVVHFSQEGDLVLDPFGGSFTTARVAQRLGRRWISGDINPEYVERARAELERPAQMELRCSSCDG